MEPFPPDAPLSASSASSDGAPPLHTTPPAGARAATQSSASSSSVATAASDSASQPSSVPAACLGCRAKHLKCDGSSPCSRCVGSSSECVYIASRRGYKGPRRRPALANPNKRRATSSPPPPSTGSGSSAGCPMLLGANPVSLPTSTVPAFSPGIPPQTTQFPPAATIVGYNPAVPLPATQPPSTFGADPALSNVRLLRNPFAAAAVSGSRRPGLTALSAHHASPSLPDRCFDAFYYFFHGGHPFVLPKDALLRAMKDGMRVEVLVAAMRYIGSLFIDAGPARARYFDDAYRMCYDPATPKDGFLVQALLLLIVGLDGSCQQEKARELLSDCERIAVEINLNRRPFAAVHGRGDPVYEESWRRTWWDLYVCDGMIAGVHRVTNFLLFDIPADVGLPCEEHEYLSGQIPQTMYVEDFDDQLFSGEERPFSSFAYRIAAARNLGRLMRTPTAMFPGDDNVARVQALLTNWRMHLPETKRYNINKFCELDEMMFQAHFMTSACTIILHQPLSQLDTSPARGVDSCAPHRQIASGQHYNEHTQFTLNAALEITKMVTQPVSLLRHTHFFTCVLTLSSIVHLSKWAQYFIQDEDELRQPIRLNIGALSKLKEVWKAAEMAYGQVKGVAQEIYREKKSQQINPAFWVTFTQEQMISSINTDEGIMSEFDSILSQAHPNT